METQPVDDMYETEPFTDWPDPSDTDEFSNVSPIKYEEEECDAGESELVVGTEM